MVLILNGVQSAEFPQDSETLYKSYPVYKKSAEKLLGIPKSEIGAKVGLLYVQQREFAATVSHNKNINIIGSDDATTCLIVVIRNSGSGAVALAHLDGCATDMAVSNMIKRLSSGQHEGTIELQIIGGYWSDTKEYSEKLFNEVMNAFHNHSTRIELTVACVGQMNTVQKGSVPWPIIYGIGVDVKSGQIFPATFLDKGPDLALRTARHIFSDDDSVIDIYDNSLDMIRIMPFNYEVSSYIDFVLKGSDELILKYMSTSPDVEPLDFVKHLKEAFKFVKNNPMPARVFQNNQPRCFSQDKQTGIWTQVIDKPNML